MNPAEEKLKRFSTGLALVANSGLFLLKLVLGILSGSIAVISDAFHSLMDVVASVVIAIGVKIGREQPDEDHQFGHHRAEPIAGLIIAVIAGILAFEIVRESIFKIFETDHEIFGSYAITALIITIGVKFGLSIFFHRTGKKIHSSGIRALAVDSRNDVLATAVALFGVILAELGLSFFDPVAGIIVAVFIFKGGYEIGLENIDYLMGKSADEDLVQEIRYAALSVNGVMGLNTFRTHYVGQLVHVEIHIEVDHQLSIVDSHLIAETVENEIEKLREVGKAFVHVDPVILLPDGRREIANFHDQHPHLD